MKRDEIKIEIDYKLYLTPVWIYVCLLLIWTPIVLFLGWEFGR